MLYCKFAGSTWCKRSRQRDKHCVCGDERFLYAECETANYVVNIWRCKLGKLCFSMQDYGNLRSAILLLLAFPVAKITGSRPIASM